MKSETRTTVEKRTVLDNSEVVEILTKHLKLKNARFDFLSNCAGDFTGVKITTIETTVH